MRVTVREAEGTDASRLAKLIRLVRHEVDSEGVAGRLASVDCPQLVAEDDGEIVGLCGLHMMTAIHRDYPVGRITILVVAEDRRGEGIGKALVDSAIRYFRDSGCELLEVTSHDRLLEAHAFYNALGFEQTSKRFALQLA